MELRLRTKTSEHKEYQKEEKEEGKRENNMRRKEDNKWGKQRAESKNRKPNEKEWTCEMKISEKNRKICQYLVQYAIILSIMKNANKWINEK